MFLIALRKHRTQKPQSLREYTDFCPLIMQCWKAKKVFSDTECLGSNKRLVKVSSEFLYFCLYFHKICGSSCCDRFACASPCASQVTLSEYGVRVWRGCNGVYNQQLRKSPVEVALWRWHTAHNKRLNLFESCSCLKISRLQVRKDKGFFVPHGLSIPLHDRKTGSHMGR